MTESLQETLDRTGSAVELLRNAQAPPTVFPVRPEFTNWRSEQRARRESCALLDQSHHMTDLFVRGPDALRLFSDLGVNTFEDFADRAKQFVAVNDEGYLIGDGILFHLGPDEFDLVGWRMAIDWVRFRLETGDYEATAELEASVGNACAEPGTEVTVVWGEQPNSRKPAVEPHVQVEIRAVVAPAPYVDFARRDYRSS